MADSNACGLDDLVLVSDQYQPLHPMRALVVGEDPDRPHLVKVMYRESCTVVWVDRRRIGGVESRAQGNLNDRERERTS